MMKHENTLSPIHLNDIPVSSDAKAKYHRHGPATFVPKKTGCKPALQSPVHWLNE